MNGGGWGLMGGGRGLERGWAWLKGGGGAKGREGAIRLDELEWAGLKGVGVVYGGRGFGTRRAKRGGGFREGAWSSVGGAGKRGRGLKGAGLWEGPIDVWGGGAERCVSPHRFGAALPHSCLVDPPPPLWGAQRGAQRCWGAAP